MIKINVKNFYGSSPRLPKCYILLFFLFLSLSLPHISLLFLFLRKKKSLTSKHWTYLNFWALRHWKSCDNSNVEYEYGRREGRVVDYTMQKARKHHKNALQTLSPNVYLNSGHSSSALKVCPFLENVQLWQNHSQSSDCDGRALTWAASLGKWKLVIRHYSRSN